MAGGHGELRGGLVAVELHVLALVVLLRHFLAVHLGFPSHNLIVAQRDLDVQIVLVRLHAAFGFLLAFEVQNVHKQVLAVQENLARRQFFEIILVVKLHEFFQSGYAVEVPISVF